MVERLFAERLLLFFFVLQLVSLSPGNVAPVHPQVVLHETAPHQEHETLADSLDRISAIGKEKQKQRENKKRTKETKTNSAAKEKAGIEQQRGKASKTEIKVELGAKGKKKKGVKVERMENVEEMEKESHELRPSEKEEEEELLREVEELERKLKELKSKSSTTTKTTRVKPTPEMRIHLNLAPESTGRRQDTHHVEMDHVVHHDLDSESRMRVSKNSQKKKKVSFAEAREAHLPLPDLDLLHEDERMHAPKVSVNSHKIIAQNVRASSHTDNDSTNPKWRSTDVVLKKEKAKGRVVKKPDASGNSLSTKTDLKTTAKKSEKEKAKEDAGDVILADDAGDERAIVNHIQKQKTHQTKVEVRNRNEVKEKKEEKKETDVKIKDLKEEAKLVKQLAKMENKLAELDKDEIHHVPPIRVPMATINHVENTMKPKSKVVSKKTKPLKQFKSNKATKPTKMTKPTTLTKLTKPTKPAKPTKSPPSLIRVPLKKNVHVIDPCDVDPCPKNQPCHVTSTGFRCGFDRRFSTESEEDKISNSENRNSNRKKNGPCSSNPCQNGGSCENQGRKFLCYCRNGYAGDRCSRPVNPCIAMESLCQNGATCVPVRNAEGRHVPKCMCEMGWEGDFCDSRKRWCSESSCRNGGSCYEIDHEPMFRCACTSAWQGLTCEAPRDPCMHADCEAEKCRPDIHAPLGYACEGHEEIEDVDGEIPAAETFEGDLSVDDRKTDSSESEDESAYARTETRVSASKMAPTDETAPRSEDERNKFVFGAIVFAIVVIGAVVVALIVVKKWRERRRSAGDLSTRRGIKFKLLTSDAEADADSEADGASDADLDSVIGVVKTDGKRWQRMASDGETDGSDEIFETNV